MIDEEFKKKLLAAKKKAYLLRYLNNCGELVTHRGHLFELLDHLMKTEI